MRDGVYSIFDTAASEIYISILWYESLVEKLFEKATTTYETKNGATYASCTANYPNLYFMLDGYWLQIPPVDYLVDISEAQDGQVCRIRIRPIDAPFNIMGMPAYLGYYVTHNWSEGYMEFSPHLDSERAPLREGFVPTKKLALTYKRTNVKDGNYWAFGIAVLIAIGFAIIWTQYWR